MPGQITAVYQYRDPQVTDAYYSTDEFRMFGFKIIPCPRTRSHDWTDCPLAHRGEKATRRDPSKFNYMAIACPYFKSNNGECPLGETCSFAHGIFEYWLHPAKYRTRPCHMGCHCKRKVCFFAHGPDQLRTEIKYKVEWTNSSNKKMNACLEGGGKVPVVVKAILAAPNGSTWEKVIGNEKVMDGTEVIEQRLRDLSMVDQSVTCLNDHIDWVSQLLDDNLDW